MEDLNSGSHILTPQELYKVLLLTLLFFFLGTIFAGVMVLFGLTKVALLAEVLFIIPAIATVLARRRPFLKSFRFNSINPGLLYYSVIIAFSVLILGDELDRLIGIVFPLPSWFDPKPIMEIHSIWDGVLIIGNAVVVAALAEEMLFRGMVQQTLESVHETGKAILLSAIFFALLHLNPWWMIQITLLGLALGYMAWKSDSIIPTVIIHGLNNLLAVISLNTGEAKMEWYLSGGHVRWYWLALAALLVVPGFMGFQRVCDARHHQQII
jgi:uncharacterized protein